MRQLNKLNTDTNSVSYYYDMTFIKKQKVDKSRFSDDGVGLMTRGMLLCLLATHYVANSYWYKLTKIDMYARFAI
jgi:hypothetical protein